MKLNEAQRRQVTEWLKSFIREEFWEGEQAVLPKPPAFAKMSAPQLLLLLWMTGEGVK